MEKTSIKYHAYRQILEEELLPAMGCTEPIALALAAALARDLLGMLPDRIHVQVSGSMIKNVKSVIVPNTDNMKGIQTAAAAGIIAGKAEKELEVIADVSPEQTEAIKEYLKKTEITVEHIEYGHPFDIIVSLYKEEHSSRVRLCDHHTNIVLLEHDGRILKQVDTESGTDGAVTDRTLLNLSDIWDFATTCNLDDVRELLERQIKYNTAISREGLSNDYGARVGKTIMQVYGSGDVRTRAKAGAAAGSDARMNGCEMPVIINSGSGNQGITCSVPVIVYAEALGSSHEELLRALVISNLVAIHEKTGIGTLSAYCGAVSAAAGAGAGIAYLFGAGLDAIKGVVTNTLGTVSGIVCDGAKASCASKIAQSIDMAILGFEMWKNGSVFQPGDGLIEDTVEKTIDNIGRLGRYGMEETNNEIIRMMIAG